MLVIKMTQMDPITQWCSKWLCSTNHTRTGAVMALGATLADYAFNVSNTLFNGLGSSALYDVVVTVLTLTMICMTATAPTNALRTHTRSHSGSCAIRFMMMPALAAGEPLRLLLSRDGPTIVLVAAVSALGFKFRERITHEVKSFYKGWKTAPNRLLWVSEVSFGLLVSAANPARAVIWLGYFLLRNVLGVTPYFAWFFFVNLILYIVVGGLVMCYSKPGSRIRVALLTIGPIWLRLLTVLYDWGYFPFILLFPASLQSLGGPAGLRICFAPLIGVILPVPGGIGETIADAVAITAQTQPSVIKEVLKVQQSTSSPITRGPLKLVYDGVSRISGVRGAYWLQSIFLPTNAKPGTLRSWVHHHTTHAITPAGTVLEEFVTNYMKEHNLENQMDGRLRAMSAYAIKNSLSGEQMLQLVKQYSLRSAPVATAAAAAYGAVKFSRFIDEGSKDD